MVESKTVHVKVFSGDINIPEFIANCERAGLTGVKRDPSMNLMGHVKEEKLSILKRVPGVTKVEVLDY